MPNIGYDTKQQQSLVQDVDMGEDSRYTWDELSQDVVGSGGYEGNSTSQVNQFLNDMGLEWTQQNVQIENLGFEPDVLKLVEEKHGFAKMAESITADPVDPPGVATAKAIYDAGAFALTTGIPMLTGAITGTGQHRAEAKLEALPRIDEDGFFLEEDHKRLLLTDNQKDYLLNYRDETENNETSKDKIESLNRKIRRVNAGEETGDIGALVSSKAEWTEKQKNSQAILDKHQKWYDTIKYSVEERRERALSDIDFWRDLRNSWQESFSHFVEDHETLRARQAWLENTPFNLGNVLKEPKKWVAYGIGSALPSIAIAAAATAVTRNPALGIGVFGAIGSGNYYSAHYDEYTNESPATKEDYFASENMFRRQLEKEYEEGINPDKGLTGDLDIDLASLMDETYREENGEYIRLALSNEEAHQAVGNKALLYGVAEGVLEFLPMSRVIKTLGRTGKKQVLKKMARSASDGSKFSKRMKTPLAAATNFWISQGILEGMTEMSQRAAEIMVEGGFMTGDLDPKLGALGWDLDKIINDDEFWKSGWSGMWGGLVMGGAGGISTYKKMKTVKSNKKAQSQAREVYEKLERGLITDQEANKMIDDIVAESLLGEGAKKVGEDVWRGERQTPEQRQEKWVKSKKQVLVGDPKQIFAASENIRKNLSVLDNDKKTKRKKLKEWKNKFEKIEEGTDLTQREFEDFNYDLNEFVEESGAHDRVVENNPDLMASLFPYLVNGEKGIIKVSSLSPQYQKAAKLGKHAPLPTIEDNTIPQMLDFADANKITVNRKARKKDLYKEIIAKVKEAKEIKEFVPGEKGAEAKYLKGLVGPAPSEKIVSKPAKKYELESHIYKQQKKEYTGEKLLEFIAHKGSVEVLDSLNKNEISKADDLISGFMRDKLGKEFSVKDVQLFKELYAAGAFPFGLTKSWDAATGISKLRVKKGQEKKVLELFVPENIEDISKAAAKKHMQEYINLVGDPQVSQKDMLDAFLLAQQTPIPGPAKITKDKDIDLSQKEADWAKMLPGYQALGMTPKQLAAQKKAFFKEKPAVTPDPTLEKEVDEGGPVRTISEVTKLTPKLLKDNPDKVYLFGDNLEGRGKGGQAVIRDEPNAFGIPTKKKPSKAKDAFFTDAELTQNKKDIDAAFAKIPTDKEIVLPKAGLGTGLAELKTRAPKTYNYLQEKISELKGEKPPITKAPTKKTKKVTDEEKLIKNGKKNLKSLFDKGTDADTSQVDKIKLQTALVDRTKLIVEEKDYAKILGRLQKKMPWVRSFSGSFIVKEIASNPDAFGRAAGAMVEWTEKAGLETPPHEFFHVYWGMMEGTPVYKRAMKIIGKSANETEEELAMWVGKYYVDRAIASVPKKVAIWFRQFWSKLKKTFAPSTLSEEDIKQIIADEFYRGVRLEKVVVPDKFRAGIRYYTRRKEETSDPLEDFLQDRAPYSSVDDVVGKEDGIQEDNRQEDKSDNSKEMRISLIRNKFSILLDRHVDEKEFSTIISNALVKDFNDWKTYLEEEHKKKSLTKKEKDYAKLVWQKMRSRVERADIGVFDLLNVDPDSGNVLTTKAFRVNQGHDPRTGKFLGKYSVKNFVQEDDIIKNLNMLPLNHVIKAVHKRGKYKEEAEFGDTKDKKMYWLFKDSASLDPESISNWDRDFANVYIKEKGEQPLRAFFAPKGGDASTLFFIDIDENIIDGSLSEEYVNNYWANELAKKLISKKMHDEIIAEYEVYKNEENIEEYTPLAMAQLMGRHETWKKIKWDKYAADAKNLQDMFDRLKLDFAQGFVPRGAGPVKTLFFNPKDVVIKMIDENFVQKDVTENLFFEDKYIGDGWIPTSGKYLQRIADVIGRDTLSVIKTVQRHRGDLNEVGEVSDYINMKGLLGVVPKGFNIFEKNKDGSAGKWIIRTAEEDLDGKRIIKLEARDDKDNWVEIDMLGTPDERKQVAGKYNKFNTIEEIPEGFTRILQIPPKTSKTSATFPFQWASMLMDPSFKKEVGKDIDIVEDYVTRIAEVYWRRLFALRRPSDKKGNYTYLYNELYRGLKENEMPEQIDRYIKMLGNHPALLHPMISGRAISETRNRFIIDGAYSGRRLGSGTITHFKPDMMGQIKDKNIIVSADNILVFDEVQKRYQEMLKETLSDNDFKEKSNEYMGFYFEEKVAALNEFLNDNEVKSFIHRVPVIDIYGAQIRRIQKLETGGQGDVTFMTHNDVFNVFQGDHDGDKININFVPTEVETALENITNSNVYKEKRRVTRLNIFKHHEEVGTLMSQENFYNMSSSVARAEAATGIMPNLRSLYSNVLMRNLELSFRYGKNSFIVKAIPSDRHIVFREGLLDNKELEQNPELLKEIYDRGDRITYEENNVVGFANLAEAKKHIKSEENSYLVTTPDHILAIWTQAAVDNAKEMLLSKWGYVGRETIFKYMFQMPEGDKPQIVLSNGISSFLTMINTSQLKSGRTQDGRNVETHTLFEEAKEMSDFAGMDAKQQGEDLAFRYSEIVSERKNMPVLKNVSVNGEMTTVEKIISSLWEAKEKDHSKYPQHRMEWGGSPLTFDDDTLIHAHVMAVKQLSESEIVKDVKDRSIKDSKVRKSVDEGRNVGDDLAQEFYDVAAANERFEQERNVNINSLTYDYNEEIQNFIDKFYNTFQELSPDTQKMATLQFLRGATVRTMIKGTPRVKNFKRVIQLLPLDLMNQDMIKEYLVNWGVEFAKPLEGEGGKNNDLIPENPQDIEYVGLEFLDRVREENIDRKCP